MSACWVKVGTGARAGGLVGAGPRPCPSAGAGAPGAGPRARPCAAVGCGTAALPGWGAPTLPGRGLPAAGRGFGWAGPLLFALVPGVLDVGHEPQRGATRDCESGTGV